MAFRIFQNGSPSVARCLGSAQEFTFGGDRSRAGIGEICDLKAKSHGTCRRLSSASGIDLKDGSVVSAGVVNRAAAVLFDFE